MNLLRNPELVDRLAADYAVGSLRGGARRRFEDLARRHAPVHAAALTWQARLAGLTELQAEARPSPAVWTRIDNLVRADDEQRAMRQAREAGAAPAAENARGTGWRSLLLWRTVAIGGVLAAVFAVQNAGEMREQYSARVAQLQRELKAMPQVQYVAVLSNDQSDASMLVTFDPNNKRLTLKQVSGYAAPAGKSLQLWALPPSGAPRSLGVLGSEAVQRLPASENEVSNVPTLAISLEPLGGVPSDRGPTGPVLFKGALLQTQI